MTCLPCFGSSNSCQLRRKRLPESSLNSHKDSSDEDHADDSSAAFAGLSAAAAAVAAAAAAGEAGATPPATSGAGGAAKPVETASAASTETTTTTTSTTTTTTKTEGSGQSALDAAADSAKITGSSSNGSNSSSNSGKKMASTSGSHESWLEAEFDTLEESLNVLTHVLAGALGVAAVAHLLAQARQTAQMACAVVYGTAMVLLFLGSSVYHVTLLWPRLKQYRNVFLRVDRSMIYVFIAAYLTPYLVLSGLYWMSVAGVWALCVLCLLLQNILHDWHSHQAVFLAVIASVPSVTMIALLPPAVAYKILLGGVAYAVGFIFYNLQGRMRFAHAMWHCCVNVATWLQFDAMAMHLYSGEVRSELAGSWIPLPAWIVRIRLAKQSS